MKNLSAIDELAKVKRYLEPLANHAARVFADHNTATAENLSVCLDAALHEIREAIENYAASFDVQHGDD